MESQRKKVLFVHIPKCAGVSMAEALSAQAEILRIGPHGKCVDIFGEGGQLKREACLSFSFVRNPWDRLVSTFFYMMKGGRAEIDRQRRDRYLQKYNGDFRSFVRDIENWFSIQEENSIYPDKFIPHFRPQHEYVCDANGKVMVDFIGRVEDITLDFGKLCDLLSLSDIRLKRSNKSSHRAYQKYYDNETRNLVAKYYAKDIELFSYAFEPPRSLFAGLLNGLFLRGRKHA